jgi:hypothetical protein
MLHDGLKRLERYGGFELLGAAKTGALGLETVRRGEYDDGHSGERLDEIGERVGLGNACLEKGQACEEEVYRACQEQWGD